MDQWQHKVVIVTDASSRLGAQLCRQLCSFPVILVGLTPHLDRLNVLGEEIHESCEDAQFHAVQCDLAHEDEIQTALEYCCSEFGGVDVLINCGSAEIRGESSSFLDPSDGGGIESAESVIKTDVLGLVSIARKAYQSMVERGAEGYIINISATSERESQTKSRCSSIGAVSRAAVGSFTAELARELCGLDQPKIRVSNIVAVNLRDVGDEEGNGGEFGGFDESGNVGRCIGPSDIADTVLYCLSTPAHVQIKEMQVGAAGGRF